MWFAIGIPFTLLSSLIGVAVSQGVKSVLTQQPYTLVHDSSFNFQLLLQMGTARYRGASTSDVFSAAQVLKPMNMSLYNSTFYELAQRSQKRAEAAGDRTTAQDNYFLASNYYRQADFYLHANWSDPHIKSYWQAQTSTFNQAIAALPVPGERVTIPADGFNTIGIFYRPDNCSIRRPTILIGNGYDAAQEDSLHGAGFAFLEQGWNVMTYEGPGQPTVRRDQNLGFIYDWEKVVTPAVDYLASRPDVDMSRLTLQGISMGGYLALRAAAFEPRIKALVLDEGVYSVFDAYTTGYPPALLNIYNEGNQTAFDAIFEKGVLYNSSAPTNARWGVAQGLWSFNTHSPYDWIKQTEKFTIANITDKIQMPVWVGYSVNDTSFPGQAPKVAKALGSRATLHTFTGVASLHCAAGASEESNWAIFEWLGGVFGKGNVSLPVGDQPPLRLCGETLLDSNDCVASRRIDQRPSMVSNEPFVM